MGSLISNLSFTDIPEPENRAISLRQLIDVYRYIEDHCVPESWTGARPDGSGNWTQVPLTPEIVNLYDATDRVIKRATESHSCSFVELIADGPQPTTYFVSHWWGEPIRDFVACLQQHANDHAIGVQDAETGDFDGAGAFYWVCAYANNQWALSEYVSSDPRESAFQKAIDMARGGLTMIDRDGVVFTRIWCSFETYCLLDRSASTNKIVPINHDVPEKFTYDFYTAQTYEVEGRGTNSRIEQLSEKGLLYPKKRNAVGITDGSCTSDGDPPHHFWAKSEREAGFRAELAQKTVSICIEKADASEESDKKHILNCFLEAADLEQTPPDTSPVYDELNRRLRGKMIMPMWLTLCNADLLDERCAAAACASRALEWEINMRTPAFGERQARLTAQAFPPTLQKLNIDWMFSESMTEAGTICVYEAAARLENLRYLRFVSDHGYVAVVRFCETLKETRQGGQRLEEIDFNSSEVKDEAGEALIDAIENGHLPALTSLTIFDFDEERYMNQEVHTRLQQVCKTKEIYLSGQWD